MKNKNKGMRKYDEIKSSFGYYSHASLHRHVFQVSG